MLPQKLRIKTKVLKEIFAAGQKKSFPDFKIYYQKNVYSYPRINVVVPKNLSQKAVLRNRIKRRIRHALLELIKENKIKPKDYVFVVKSTKLAKEDFIQIKEKIIKYLNEISD